MHSGQPLTDHTCSRDKRVISHPRLTEWRLKCPPPPPPRGVGQLRCELRNTTLTLHKQQAVRMPVFRRAQLLHQACKISSPQEGLLCCCCHAGAADQGCGMRESSQVVLWSTLKMLLNAACRVRHCRMSSIQLLCLVTLDFLKGHGNYNTSHVC